MEGSRVDDLRLDLVERVAVVEGELDVLP